MQEIIVPGPLSSGHAELLMHQGADRCAACHANAHQSVGSWVGQIFGYSSAPTKTQTQLCIDCHQATMSPAVATFAHNQHPEQLKLKTQLVSNRSTTELSLTDAFLKTNFDAQRELSCSTCHREHHGQQVDMKAMTDLQCQSCHVQTIGQFETSHPAFELTAGSKTPNIDFDHFSHGRKHFVQANQSFDCAMCHKDDSTGNVKQLTSYENACASCHDGAIKLSSQKGIAFLQLPMIDPVAVRAGGSEIGTWPEDLSIDFDGRISGVTRVLLEADPQARQALQFLGEDLSWIDLDPANKNQMQAVGDVVIGLKRLLVDLSARGNEAIRQRLQVAFQHELPTDQTTGLSYGMSADTFRDARQRWFPNLLTEMELEKCFPVFQPVQEAPAKTAIGPIVFTPQLYGQLDPRFVQDVLAENPLAGQFGSHPTSGQANPGQDNAANGKAADAQLGSQLTRPANDNQQELPSATRSTAQTPPSVDPTQLLAENPLAEMNHASTADSSTASGAIENSSLPSSAMTNTVGGQRPQELATNNQVNGRTAPPASSGGELLADNPLASIAPAIARSTISQTTELGSPTGTSHNTPQNQSGSPSTGTEPTTLATPSTAFSGTLPNTLPRPANASDTLEDLQRVDQVLAAITSDTMNSSGWSRDDQMFSVSYRLSGHADPWLQHWIKLAADEKVKAGSGQQAAIQLFNHLASRQSTGTCMQCHIAASDIPATPVDHPDNLMAARPVVEDNFQRLVAAAKSTSRIQLASSQTGRLAPPTTLAPFRQISAVLASETQPVSFSWQAEYRDPLVRQFTNFNHRPHTLQTGLNDCQSCHQMVESIGDQVQTVAHKAGSDFHPMTNSNCASCHRSEGTSDQCTTCHSYHVGSRKLK